MYKLPCWLGRHRQQPSDAVPALQEVRLCVKVTGVCTVLSSPLAPPPPSDEETAATAALIDEGLELDDDETAVLLSR